MKRLLLFCSLSTILFLSVPSSSKAFWNDSQNRHGFGWWQGCALRWNAFIHFHGPLYSYGPYCGQGYAYMNICDPIIGAYLPAYPAVYYGSPNPYATVNGFMSWNGTGVQLGYPNALNANTPAYFTQAVLPAPRPAPAAKLLDGTPAPGYFPQPPPSKLQ